MTGNPSGTEVSIPETARETANWLRMLAREINTFVLFLQTWSAMGFMISPEVAGSLVELQSKVQAVRARLRQGDGGEPFEELRKSLVAIATEEEEVYRKLMKEIKRFKEESEGLFPASKLNFDPCF